MRGNLFDWPVIHTEVANRERADDGEFYGGVWVDGPRRQAKFWLVSIDPQTGLAWTWCVDP